MILQLLTALFTILSVWMAGNGDQRFSFVGLFNQILWVVVILKSHTYGLMVLTVAMTFTYSRNIWRNYGSRIHWNTRRNDL